MVNALSARGARFLTGADGVYAGVSVCEKAKAFRETEATPAAPRRARKRRREKSEEHIVGADSYLNKLVPAAA
jgi:hypothetical protein